MVYFHGPGGELLGIDHGEPAKPDPVADWTQQRNNRVQAGDLPGYQEWRLAEVPYFVRAADWEFSYDEGGRVHADNRGFITTPGVQAHAIWWSTPEDQWQANLSKLRTVYDSFTPIQH
jgi:hypothetical protein